MKRMMLSGLLLLLAWSASAAVWAQEGTSTRRYRGRHISLSLYKADIHNVLRLIAEVGRFNIIVDGTVRGRVTLRLRNIPWDQALELILQTLQLRAIQEGNVMHVMTDRAWRRAARLLPADCYPRGPYDRWPTISWSRLPLRATPPAPPSTKNVTTTAPIAPTSRATTTKSSVPRKKP